MVYPAHRRRQFLTVCERPSEYGSRPERDGGDPERDDAKEQNGSGAGCHRSPDGDSGSEAGPGNGADHPRPGLEPDTPERKAELDALEDLGDEIATLAAHIHAATYRFLALIAEFDRRRGWELGGHRTCAHWLSYRTKLDLGAAREKVRTARALTELPETSASMARGELSFSQVRALSRVATAENESDLLELARGSTTAQLERAVRAWKRGDRQDEATRERERHERRCLSIFPDDDGMYVVRGKLTPEHGALLMRALEAASDALYREDRASGARVTREPGCRQKSEGAGEGAPEPAGSGGPASGQASRCGREPESQRAARQRRADALGLLAERAMAAGFGGADGKGAPVSGTRAERYQVMLHVDAETLDAEAEPGRSELEDGTRVSGETSRRLACDAALVRITHAPDGSVLDVGRRTRTIPPALRRALEVRDRGCRFPGCGLRFTDGHHVRHWADGGETSLSNCVLLCSAHHALVHEGGWQVDWWGEGRPVFFDPRGGTHFEGRWRPPVLDGDTLDGDPVEAPDADPVEALKRDNRSCEPDWRTAGARWKRFEDIPDDVLFRAWEALG